ncbi:hypothetical protein [Methylomagnum sp.]
MPLIRLFLDICLFNKGPQDTPDSTLLLWLAVAANMVMGLVLSLPELGWGEALLQSAIAALLLAGFLWTVLTLSRNGPRFLQTAIAAFGCDTFVSATAAPLLIWSQIDPDMKGVIGLLLMALMLWQIAVIGHILRHALSVPFIAGIGLALAYTAMGYGLMMTLFPVVD